MSMSRRSGVVLVAAAAWLAGVGAWSAFHSSTAGADDQEAPSGQAVASAEKLQRRFSTQVQPFLERYCISCHGPKKPKASLDLTRETTVAAIAGNFRPWDMLAQRLKDEEMPPESAPRRPDAGERAAVLAWIRDLRDHEAFFRELADAKLRKQPGK